MFLVSWDQISSSWIGDSSRTSVLKRGTPWRRYLWAFHCYQNRLPWMTLNGIMTVILRYSLFRIRQIWETITPKWLKINILLRQKSSRNNLVLAISVTLNDLEQWPPTRAISAVAGLLVCPRFHLALVYEILSRSDNTRLSRRDFQYVITVILAILTIFVRNNGNISFKEVLIVGRLIFIFITTTQLTFLLYLLSHCSSCQN